MEDRQATAEPHVHPKADTDTVDKTVPENHPVAPAIPKVVDRPVTKTRSTTVKVGDLLKVEPKKEVATSPGRKELAEAFTAEQFQMSWDDYAATRKKFQAEFHLLSQPYDLDGTNVTLHLLSSVQESILATLRSELTTFLREKLRNDMITVNGSVREMDEKQMRYTPRDKFEYLQEKMPLLRELKDRLGLDTDLT